MSTNVYDDPALRGHGGYGAAETVSDSPYLRRRISWPAILGGVILVIALQLLLSLLGVGIGLGTINTHDGTTPDATSFGIGAAAWWVVTGVVALAFGGYASGWMAGVETRWDGFLHGLVTWGIATLLTIYLLTSAVGSLIGGGFSALGSVASAAGNGVKEAAQPLAQAAGVSPDTLQQQAQAYLQPANPDPASMSAQDAQKAIASSLATFAKGGQDAASAKERVISIVAAQQHISHEQAAKQFDDAQAKLKQAEDQAVQAAKTAADASAAAASRASFAAFADLLLGAIAAGLGGSLALARRRGTAQRVAH